MRFPFARFAMFLAVAGCSFSKGSGGDGGVDIGAGFSWSWSIESTGGDPIDCRKAGARYVRMDIADARGKDHQIRWLCDAGSAETDAWEIATGTGQVTAALLNASFEVLDEKPAFPFEFKSGELANDLGPIVFTVPVWDPTASPNASLTWEWRKALSEDWQDPYADTAPLTALDCEALGIDTVGLWIWNPEAGEWWQDPSMTGLRCDAFDHPDDDAVWGDEVYSGLHLDRFLEAGSYRMRLGFYGKKPEGGSGEVLLYQALAGSPGDPFDGALAPDAETEYGTNWAIHVFPYQDDTRFGVLKVTLQYGDAKGSYTDCVNSEVQEIGFRLSSGDWVASEVELGDGTECRDSLTFEEVPVLDAPYDLLVSGLSFDGDFLWYDFCEGLVPEEGVSLDDASGYECRIANSLAP